MALTLHFQRGAQSLRTGDGVGLGGQGPLPGLPWDSAPRSSCTPVLGALRESLTALDLE